MAELLAVSGLKEFVCKKFKSHRDIPYFVGALLDELKEDFGKK